MRARESSIWYEQSLILARPNRIISVIAVKKLFESKVSGDSHSTRTCNEGETAQRRSVVGALSWVTRWCKPELLHRAGRLQTAVRRAKVLHFAKANRAFEDAIQSADC
eukprot:4443171-Pyramimonas_sp.AAC.1